MKKERKKYKQSEAVPSIIDSVSEEEKKHIEKNLSRQRLAWIIFIIADLASGGIRIYSEFLYIARWLYLTLTGVCLAAILASAVCALVQFFKLKKFLGPVLERLEKEDEGSEKSAPDKTRKTLFSSDNLKKAEIIERDDGFFQVILFSRIADEREEFFTPTENSGIFEDYSNAEAEAARLLRLR